MLTQEAGLTTDEAQKRLAAYGPNRLVPEARRPPLVQWLVHPLTDPMVVLLLVAGIGYLFLADYLDAAIVLVALVPIALVGAVLELRAEHALEALKQLTAPTAVVWRDGQRRVIPAAEIVPGDLVEVQEGDIVPADGELVAGGPLVVDEAALTGESQAVTKSSSEPEEDRLLFAGTTVRSCRGQLRVVATGPRTRYGRIGSLVARIQQPPTPLQRLINRLIGQATVVAAVFCVGVAAIELFAGRGLVAAFTAGISLAIAALPEEFAIVYTLYLSLGAWKLAREHALVRRLASVETLGATTVICTDKTGTLTVGRVEIAALATPTSLVWSDEPLPADARRLIEAAVLASEPAPFDPLDQAIVRYASAHGVDVAALHRQRLVQDYPFDPILKYVSHVWEGARDLRIYAKGSIEGILERSRATAEERRAMLKENQALAARGLRVIAVAMGELPDSHGDRRADECHLSLLGLVAFADPPRPGVTAAIRECCQAGIRVIMLTGDHPVTAHAVAEEIGLPHVGEVVTGDDLETLDPVRRNRRIAEANIFARMRPEQKFELVRQLRAQGQIVAMTGDGINDAPALREADIGVAMGERGTEVAREAADLVLLDDNFATIVGAVCEGRHIFENLRRAFAYLIAFEAPLLLAALVIPLTGLPLLLLPSLLILSELIVHPTVSLVFQADPAPPDLMHRPPRPAGAGLLAGADLIRAVAEGLTLGAGVLLLYLILLAARTPVVEARGTAIAALLIGQTILVLVERSPRRPLRRTSITTNRVLPWVIAATLGSMLLVLYLPPLARVLQLVPPSPFGWLLAVITAAATTLWIEPLKGWLRIPGQTT